MQPIFKRHTLVPNNNYYCSCSWHGFTYIRGWMQMVLAPNDLFSWNNDTMSTMLFKDIYTLHFLPGMRVNTYSVHNRFLKPWWGCLLCFLTSCHVFSPPLSELNWRLLTPTGGPGPPTPKVASPSAGSAHTAFPGSRIVRILTMYSGKNAEKHLQSKCGSY